MSEEARVRRPALAHLFWWFMFAQGGIIAAILIPVHVLVQGILGPLGFVPVVDRHYDTWIGILGNPIVKLYLLVLMRSRSSTSRTACATCSSTSACPRRRACPPR